MSNDFKNCNNTKDVPLKLGNHNQLHMYNRFSNSVDNRSLGNNNRLINNQNITNQTLLHRFLNTGIHAKSNKRNFLRKNEIDINILYDKNKITSYFN